METLHMLLDQKIKSPVVYLFILFMSAEQLEFTRAINQPIISAYLPNQP